MKMKILKFVFLFVFSFNLFESIKIQNKNIQIGIKINSNQFNKETFQNYLKWLKNEINNLNIENNKDIINKNEINDIFICIYNENKLKPLYNQELFEILKESLILSYFSNSLFLSSFCSFENPNLFNYNKYDGLLQLSIENNELPSFQLNELTNGMIGSNLEYFYFDINFIPSVLNEIRTYNEKYLKENHQSNNNNILSLKLQQFIQSKDFQPNLEFNNSQYNFHYNFLKNIDSNNNDITINELPNRANNDKYHTSGPCNLWWPLNDTELYIYSSSSSSLVYSHLESIIIICPNMLKYGPFSVANPIDEQFLLILEQLPVHTHLASTDRIGSHSNDVGHMELTGEQIITKPLELRINFLIKPYETQKRLRLFICPIYSSEINHIRKKPLSRIQSKMKTKSCLSIYDLKLNIIRSDYVYPKPSLLSTSSFELNKDNTCSYQQLQELQNIQQNKRKINLIPMIGIIPTRDIFGYVLTTLGYNTGTMVEIGVNRGHYASKMLSQWNGNTYILVDPWMPMPNSEYVDIANLETIEEHEVIFQEALKSTKDYTNRTIILRNTSMEASKLIMNNTIDIVYIDGLHHYQGVWDDITSWWPKLKSGGIMAGHDYMQEVDSYGTIFTVKAAVDEFARKLNLIVYRTQDSYPTWFVFKN